MAAVAAVSAREAGNECPIHLHTNIAQASSSKVLSGIFDKIVVEDEPNNHCLYVKIEAYNRSPFHKTLVMDADQIVLKKIDDALKSILDGFEICAPLRCTPARVKYSIPGLDNQEQFSHCNTGVFAFKKTKNIEYLFETWHEIHQ
jgi:alpha-N-acetylglucosamine transferase